MFIYTCLLHVMSGLNDVQGLSTKLTNERIGESMSLAVIHKFHFYGIHDLNLV